MKVYDGNTLLGTYSMGSVAAGSYRNASVTISGSKLGNGARKLFLVVDSNNQVAESNEANNKAYRTVNVTDVRAAIPTELPCGSLTDWNDESIACADLFNGMNEDNNLLYSDSNIAALPTGTVTDLAHASIFDDRPWGMIA